MMRFVEAHNLIAECAHQFCCCKYQDWHANSTMVKEIETVLFSCWITVTVEHVTFWACPSFHLAAFQPVC